MAKKVFTFIIFFAFIAKVAAQIEVNSSNQVGIGTTNPQYKLHVVGDAFVTGNFLLGNASFLGTTGAYPVLFKSNNVQSGSTGSANNTDVYFGYETLLNPPSHPAFTGNTAVGYSALRGTYPNYSAQGLTGHNTAIGSYALYSNEWGSYNTANGSYALYSNTGGGNNTAIGYYALYANKSSNNTANGSYALYSNTTGNNNTAVGYYALYSNTTGQRNVANGRDALYSNTTGAYNTAIGCGTLYTNSTGIYNSAIGANVLSNNTSGNYNTAIGNEALLYNTSGNFNTAIGYMAFRTNISGDYNIAIGRSYSNNTSGSYNTIVGCNAGPYSNNINNIINFSTTIGYGAQVTTSNQVRIGNASITSIGGYAAWSNISDGRIKKNIRKDVPGLAFINDLQPITYNLDMDAIDELMKYEEPEVTDEGMEVPPPKSEKLIELERKAREAKEQQVQTGFVAQDVEKAAKGVGYDFSGVDVDEMGIYSLRYAEFVVPLVKAVQELSQQNDRLQEQINELNKRIEALERK